jgi:hypothetical protein
MVMNVLEECSASVFSGSQKMEPGGEGRCMAKQETLPMSCYIIPYLTANNIL